MKTILKFTIVLLLMASCHSEAKKVTKELLKTVEQTEEKGADQPSDFDKITNGLLQKTPLTDEELLGAFPKELIGHPLDKVSAIPYMQQVVGQFGNRKISLSIADAAGKNNPLVTTFLGFYSYVPPSTDKIKLIKIERDGIKTISETKYNETEMKFIYDNRFHVSLSAKAMDPDELWNAFDINALRGYKNLNK
ncbi:hypothetical protein HPE56_15890 [Maribacter sp. ANRC-HE7]|uniref:Uncharacterized protein n=1 Tax=Maribacter aquimaris TaxID=2737171 RepID=A0ABR7V7L4_9FLAO|nr:hypothetical protein [Maribacter aquimaris]MBD0779282.1 hypothetical protein [Maribacter aquimaris]